MSILEARDEQVERLTEKLSMSKEALQGHKERHSEKVSALETLVLQLRQKMAEGASGEGDAVWAKRLEDEHKKRENLQNELDKLAVMFERVEQEVQRQRKVNSALHLRKRNCHTHAPATASTLLNHLYIPSFSYASRVSRVLPNCKFLISIHPFIDKHAGDEVEEKGG